MQGAPKGLGVVMRAPVAHERREWIELLVADGRLGMQHHAARAQQSMRLPHDVVDGAPRGFVQQNVRDDQIERLILEVRVFGILLREVDGAAHAFRPRLGVAQHATSMAWTSASGKASR